jgi:hypothetical protein
LQIGEKYNPHKLFVGVFIPNTLLRYHKLSHGAKIVWGRLAQYAGENGEAYPKISSLADETGMSDRQVKTYLKELREHKLIKSDRTGSSNKYHFLWHEIFEEALSVKNGEGKNPAHRKGRILPIGREESCPSDKADKTLQNGALEAENEALRESINENQKERGDTLNSLNKKEQDNPVVKWKELYEKHYNFVPKVTGREGKVLKDTVKQYGYDCTIKLLDLYLKYPTPNEKENGNPLPWLPGAINRLLSKIKEAEEYAKRLARSDEEARQMNERMRQHEEEQRKEEARRAAMSEEARQLDDLYSERIRLISRIDIRLLTNRDYSELESRLRELDRQEIELTRQPIAASC